MADSSPPSNTTSTTELPDWAIGSAKDFLQRGTSLSNNPMPVYQGQRSADMNQYQQTGLGQVYSRATQGSPEIAAGSANLQSTLNGSFLNGNPYLQSQIDQASQDITRNYQGATNNTDATFARQGAFGGSAWQQAQEGNARQLATGLSDMTSNMRFQNYAGERQNQMNALGLAPTYGNQAYVDAQHLMDAGGQQYAYDQQKIADQIAAFNEQAQSPYKQLDVLGNTIRGAVGGGGTTTQSAPGANPWAQAAGGAAAAAGIYGMLGK